MNLTGTNVGREGVLEEGAIEKESGSQKTTSSIL